MPAKRLPRAVMPARSRLRPGGAARNRKFPDSQDIVPFFNSPRVIAQDGAYTIHPNPWRPLDCYQNEPFEKGWLDIMRLYAWAIPSGAKIEILQQLSKLVY